MVERSQYAHGSQGQGFWIHTTGVDTLGRSNLSPLELCQVSPYPPTQLNHIVTIVSA